MSDAELRALERRWRASGAQEDHAAWLEAAQRAGVLVRDLTTLAAALGHGAARRAVGWVAPPLAPSEWLRHAVDALRGRRTGDGDDAGSLLLARAALAAGRVLTRSAPHDDAIAALRACVEARGADARAARQAVQRLALEQHEEVSPRTSPKLHALTHVLMAAGHEELQDELFGPIAQALDGEEADVARAALAEELAGWLLDPGPAGLHARRRDDDIMPGPLDPLHDLLAFDLRARLAAGSLDAGRLRLVAFAGHRAARRALDVRPRDVAVGQPEEIARAGRASAVRALVALARADLGLHAPGGDAPARAARALSAAEAWLAAPGSPGAAAARLAGDQAAGTVAAYAALACERAAPLLAKCVHDASFAVPRERQARTWWTAQDELLVWALSGAGADAEHAAASGPASAPLAADLAPPRRSWLARLLRR